MPRTPLQLDGRIACVTGGTSGIGRALSLGLAEAGADVVASSRDATKVEAVATEIESLGRRTLRAVCDVAEPESIERLRARVVESLGALDVLVNCAGHSLRVATAGMDEADWQGIIDTNLTGTLRCCQVFGRHMLERGQGRIINIASLSSFVGFMEVAAYSASKAGVLSLTRSLAVEWGPKGVNVNAIAPGIFVTDLNRELLEGTPRGRELRMRTPLGRFGRLEELAGAAAFLASDAASFVNGEVITVDGGFLASGVNQ